VYGKPPGRAKARALMNIGDGTVFDWQGGRRRGILRGTGDPQRL